MSAPRQSVFDGHMTYEHLREEIELKNGFGPDDAIFACGYLIGGFLSSDTSYEEKALISELLVLGMTSEVPFVASRCLEWYQSEMKKGQ